MLNKEIIDKFKEKEGLTDTDLANYIGVGQPSFSHYRQGLRPIAAWQLKRLAERFGVTMDELYTLPKNLQASKKFSAKKSK